ncbi:MAG: 30S ribosomal protein S21 [Candidatus Liptonbacteria bacterium]|nr:30S ribosomal protein S21 [Candidatus Liptonbacteria bacterium]
MITVKQRQNESSSMLLYRFTKRVKQSGILKEAKKRRFRARPQNRRKRLLSALHRARKRATIERLRRHGEL